MLDQNAALATRQRNATVPAATHHPTLEHLSQNNVRAAVLTKNLYTRRAIFTAPLVNLAVRQPDGLYYLGWMIWI
jgi:hypothetical protein